MEQYQSPAVYELPVEEKLQAAVEVGRITIDEANLYIAAYLKHLKGRGDGNSA